MADNTTSIDPGPGIGGVSGAHPEEDVLLILAAPMIAGKGKNTIRMELIPVACWQVHDVRFAFGSSFVLPTARTEFQELAKLRKDHAGAPLSVFGHADPVGDDIFNKILSGHRAEAVHAVLVRDVAQWEKLYNTGSGEGWGKPSVDAMLGAVGSPTVKDFQAKSGLVTDGIAGPKSRAKLFAAYMDFLSPETLGPQDFLARGADAGHKGDVQGCGEFNPMMVFSQVEDKRLKQQANKPERDTKNAVNRRVMVLLFRPGSVVPIDKWPCPRTSEGVADCHKRFWSDGEQRRSPQAAHREFGQTQDTFACRFYHRLVVHSPCEGVIPPPPRKSHWIQIELVDSLGKPAAGVCYRIELPDGMPVTGNLDMDGRATVKQIAGGTCRVTFPDLDGSAWTDA